MSDLHVTVRPQGRWGEVRIHWTTVDGPDSSLIYLPIEDAREMERKLSLRVGFMQKILRWLTVGFGGACPGRACLSAAARSGRRSIHSPD